ncbi:MAG: TolC family protein [Spirochaetaceae bacterium]|jgi:outer membrane protein TolC|nr:TolC family protein [Spirochaetaceae bacterium]
MERVPRPGLVCAAALFFVIAFQAGAEDGPGGGGALSLDRAVELALEQSLALQKEFIDLKTAGVSEANLWAEIFPTISAGGDLSYATPLFTEPGFQADRDLLGYGVSLGVTFRLAPSLSSSMKLLKLAYQAQLLNYENSRRQLEIQAAKTFFGLIAEKRNLVNLENTGAQAERQLEKNRVAFDNGLVSQVVFLQSSLAVENARLSLNRARALYASHLRDFLVLLGLDGGEDFELEGEIAPERVELDPGRLIDEYLVKRPDVVSQRQAIERLELAARQTALNARAPSLSLTTRWRGGSGTGASAGKFTDSLSAGLSVDIPIAGWIPGTGGQNGGQSIQSARADVEKAKLDLKNTENQARAEIRSLSENLRNSWTSIEIARLQVGLAERSYELTEEGFRNGVTETLVLENARNSLADARQQLLEVELSYMNMILDLAGALNTDWRELGK